MTYEEALSKVRKQFSKWTIQTTWEFEDNYYFRISESKSVSLSDMSALRVSVNKNTGAIATYGSSEFEVDPSNEERSYQYFVASCCNDNPVDITQEQYRKFDESRALIKAYRKYQRKG